MNRRAAFFLFGIAFVLLIAVCVPPRTATDDPFTPGRDNCVSVIVENRQFADVNVWVGQRRRRLGTIVGYTKEHFDVCDWEGTYAVFTVDPIGNAFREFQKRSVHTFLDPSHPLRLIVGIHPTPAHSQVIGQ